MGTGTMMQAARRARPVSAGLTAVGMLLLSGCSLLPSHDDPTTSPAAPTTTREGRLLPEGTTAVEVPAGEIVQVALPEGSLGVGDFWGVASGAESEIATADIAIGEDVFGVPPNPPDSTQKAGGTQQFAVEIHGLAAGETTVRVLYCTRVHEGSEGCDQSQGTLDAPVEPVEIAVRVR